MGTDRHGRPSSIMGYSINLKNPENDPFGVDLKSTYSSEINLECNFPSLQLFHMSCRARYSTVRLDHTVIGSDRSRLVVF